jgi:hypothetical protein
MGSDSDLVGCVLMKNSPEEPSSNNRQLGKITRDMFLGLVDGGFTEDQALRLLGMFLAHVARGDDEDGPEDH